MQIITCIYEPISNNNPLKLKINFIQYTFNILNRLHTAL